MNIPRCIAKKSTSLLTSSVALALVLLTGASCASDLAVAAAAGVFADADYHDGSNNSECVDSGANPDAAVDDADAHLDLLLADGVRALEEMDYGRATSIFEDIARERPGWDEMHAVQRYNGLALSKLGNGSKALWCFKNAVMLAGDYPGRQRLRRGGRGADDAFVGETSGIVQATALEYFNTVSAMLAEKVLPDPDLMYSAAQLANAVGRTDEARVLNDLLLKMRPDHGGARLLEATMAPGADGDPEGDLMRHRRILENFQLFPWDAAAAWAKVGSLECGLDAASEAGVEAWLKSFEYASSLSPPDREIATKAAVNGANTMLKRERPMEEVRRLGERAVRLGVLNAPLQLPGQLVRGVSFSAFRDDARVWRAVRHLEEHYPGIRDEVLAAYDSGGMTRDSVLDNENLHTAGEWRELNIITKGMANPKALDLLPYTSRAVMALRDGNSMVMGGSKVSLMEPGTVVRPHTGSTNARLRIHLGLLVPDGAFIRVDGETRTWTEGRCVVIDDSYVHEVWHRGNEKRIVLIVDVWHPELDALRREDVARSEPHSLEVYRTHRDHPRRALVEQGVPEGLVPDRFISERDD